MAYGDFKDLPRRTASDKAFNIAKNPKYDGYQCGFAAMVYNFFDKKSSGANISGGAMKGWFMPHQQLAEEFHKPTIRKFEEWKVISYFKDNIWGSDLTVMQLIRKYNKDNNYNKYNIMHYWYF